MKNKKFSKRLGVLAGFLSINLIAGTAMALPDSLICRVGTIEPTHKQLLVEISLDNGVNVKDVEFESPGKNKYKFHLAYIKSVSHLDVGISTLKKYGPDDPGRFTELVHAIYPVNVKEGENDIDPIHLHLLAAGPANDESLIVECPNLLAHGRR